MPVGRSGLAPATTITTRGRVLRALEVGAALLLERARPLARVLGREHGEADLELLLEPLGERPPEAGKHRSLDGAHRDRAVRDDELGEPECLGYDLLARHDPVQKAEAGELGSAHPFAGEQDL